MVVPSHPAANTFTGRCWLLWNVGSTRASAIGIIWRFVVELFMLSPILNVVVLGLGLMAGMEGAVMLYSWSRLLHAIETGLKDGNLNVMGIFGAVIARVVCTILTATIRWALVSATLKLQHRVTSHLEQVEMHAKLRMDVPTSADRSNEYRLSAPVMWSHFQCLTRMVERVFKLGSQLYFTARQPNAAVALTALTLVSPIISTMTGTVPWKHGFVVYASNVDYLRLRALKRLTTMALYQSDILSSNLGDWILAEYKKAKHALGTISDLDPQTQFMRKTTPITDALLQLSGDLPVCYWLADAVYHPERFSITSFAILQQHSMSLHHTVSGLFQEFSRVEDSLTAIKNWSKRADIQNKIPDGEHEYPTSSSRPEGMELEMINVSFGYPGARPDQAIRNVSFKIAAGNLAVIVGANGSGKSTVMKLFARLFDVDSGEILVDGLPIARYRLTDLRKGQVLFSQDFHLYPLTLAENIALGDPECAGDSSRVTAAVAAGGASELIQRLENGLTTVLAPVITSYGSQLDSNKKLRDVMEKLEQITDLSGGEKQRIVAARSFMRLLSSRIHLVMADEPSSALDAKGEQRLFEQLREARNGKTMVLVTHRFGHLTKHADLIICLKDGQVVETGTHLELIEREGEYAELYNMQAAAFSGGTQ
ncbi:P-loop containing nucleoside triphosphate hydrolase protein [Mycena vitilis]|nr:P-loop containing nucleoside triphosphate hydrolase protein [Mycena vitilis]